MISNTFGKKLKFVIPLTIYKDPIYNYIRLSELQLLSEIFDDIFKLMNIDDKSYNLTNKIIAIEKSCYDHTLEDSIISSILPYWNNELFEQLYRCKISRITKNLDIQSEVNDNYLFNLTYNTSDMDILKRISWMKTEELSPKQTSIILDKLKLRLDQKLTHKTTSLYTCKCHKNNCIIKMVQLRSLDEGENVSLTCSYCNNHWII